jgi:outer membrane receptor protein involved in Fe transport
VTDVAKGTSVTVQSNGTGDFTVEHLIPDVYDVKVDASGFKAYQQKGIQLFADTSVKVAAALSAGASDVTVEVNADAVPQLKTDRADVATIFGSKEVQDLPVAGRNFTALQLLLPGAQELGFSHAASEDPQGSKQIMVAGQTFAGVAFALDGTDNQDPILGIIVINPNLDSLSETKITTQNYDAEFGKAVASVVTAQTKSGSNKFHGSAFDYRISAANLARDPFKQGPNTPFPQALKSLFGGSIGGPILKDKVFFFGDYQGIRQKLGLSNLNTVPTAQLVATCLGQKVGTSGISGCDFSEYRNITPAGSGIIYQANGTPYPGNVIPASQVSPQAKALLALLQPFAPNSFSDNTYPGLRNNYSGSGTGILNSDQWDVRGDYQANDKIHVFGRFSRFTDTLTGTTLFGAAGGPGFGLGGYGGTSKGANDSAALGTDIAVKPTLVTDIRLGYFRYNIGTQKYSTVNLATQLGIPGLNTGAFGSGGAPGFEMTEIGSQGDPNNGQNAGPQYGSGLNTNRCNCPLIEREDQYQLVNNWTKILGSHAIKAGADLRYARNLRVPSDNNRTGILYFGTGPTSNPNLPQQGGLGFASFVLGDVTNFKRYVSTSSNAKEFQKRDFFYVQDTWRATPKLTANLGLRYEFYFPETINGPGNGALLDPNTGYLNVAGTGTVASNMNWGRPDNAWNPRVGVAYQVQPTTVIRGGYGRSFDLGVFGSIFGHAATQNLPVLSNQQVTTTTGITGSAFNLAVGPPGPTPIVVPANGLLPSPGYAVTSKARPNALRLPTIDAWNAAVQQSLSPTVSLTMAYVGNKGTHTLFDNSGQLDNPNEAAIVLPAQYSATGQQLHYDPTVKSGIAANGGTSNQTFLRRYYGGKLPACADPAYLSAAATVKPYPLAGLPAGSCGWTNDIGFYASDADTHYNSLQVTLAKTFTHGYSVNANYAWQRGTSWQNNFYTWNPRAVKGRDSNIRQQQVIIYGLAELPFGRNKLLLSHANAVVNQIVGGWQISPILNYSSGLPFTLSYSSCNASIPGSAPCMVNGDPGRFQKHVTGFPGNGLSYYDKQTLGSVFTAPGLDQIGNVGRNSVFGPHFFNTDISVQKNFPIKESVYFQFRMDAFNAFNHINFGNPGGIGSATSGNIEQNGSITNGPGVDGTANPRQLQFSARVQF